MTTTPADQPEPATVVPPAGVVGRVRARSATAVGTHAICDYFSFVLISLLPVFTTHLGLTTANKAVLIGVGTVCSGVIQPVVAWVSDKFDTRVLATGGLFLAVVSVACYGLAARFEHLIILQALATTGVGAFHPPAAAVVGRMSGARRSVGMAIFFLAGMLGGMAGNVTAPRYVSWMAERAGTAATPDIGAGLDALAWLAIPGVLACVFLAWAIHKTPHRHHAARDHHTSLGPVERRRRWSAVGVLYGANVIRFNVNLALVYLFNEWAEAHTRAQAGVDTLADTLGTQASQLNGFMQASMQLGMGGMGLLLGFTLARRFEKHAFVGFPLAGAVVIALMPIAEGVPGAGVPIALGLAVLSGVGFGCMIPVSMAVAQRLLPHRTSLASGMMLGGAWAFGFVGPLVVERVHTDVSLDAAFYTTGVALATAGLLCLALPGRLLTDAVDHH
ncbi:MAG: hypothetical protein DHS20C14_17930 [Phycisphaeraceae bacterium]|nr:MAG: hypothetical protein DHS20C14_17930 [Phycisphaeraceae bacterium]